MAAFVASAWSALRPSPASKWLLRNRRWVGLSFAVSHVTHLALIVTLARTHAASFEAHLSRATLYGGSFGYVLIAAMVATSSDRAVAWLGRARWSRLHAFGMHVLWAIFCASYAPRAARSPAYAALTAILVAAIALRAAASRRRSSRAAARA